MTRTGTDARWPRRNNALAKQSLNCWGCDEPTRWRYRELPLCLDCQRDAALMNQLDRLPRGQIASAGARLGEVAAFMACVAMLAAFLFMTRSFWIDWARMWGMIK